MAYFGFTKPSNKIIVKGPVPIMQELKAEEATIYPGRLVMKGTNDDDCKLSDTTKGVIGWAGFEDAFLGNTSVTQMRPADVDTNYATNAYVPVYSGGGFVIVGSLAAGVAAVKGELLASWTNGQLVPCLPMMGGMGIRIPWSGAKTEEDTGIDLPSGMIVMDCIVQAVTATGTIGVGILSTEAGGATSGFLASESVASSGFAVHNRADATTASITIGSFLYESIVSGIGSAFAVPKFYVCNGTAKSVTYTTSAASAGNIYLVVAAPGVQVVAKAEQTLSSSGTAQDIVVTSLI